jgi:heat shock protein HslJ
MLRRTALAVLGAAALATTALAAPPLLDVGPLPPGAWRLVGIEAEPNPWPRVDVTFVVADDGATVSGSNGCNTFQGEVAGTTEALELGPLAQTLRACAGDEATAEAIVTRVLNAASRADLIAGRLYVRGSGRMLVYAPAGDPEDPGVAGAPPLASSQALDPARFAPIVEASAASRAAWVRDPLQVALLFVATESTGRSTVVRQDAADGATTVRLWFDGLQDDAVRALWFEVDLERGEDGAWRIASGRQATWCARGDVTEVLVGGLCP